MLTFYNSNVCGEMSQVSQLSLNVRKWNVVLWQFLASNTLILQTPFSELRVYFKAVRSQNHWRYKFACDNSLFVIIDSLVYTRGELPSLCRCRKKKWTLSCLTTPQNLHIACNPLLSGWCWMPPGFYWPDPNSLIFSDPTWLARIDPPSLWPDPSDLSILVTRRASDQVFGTGRVGSTRPTLLPPPKITKYFLPHIWNRFF